MQEITHKDFLHFLQTHDSVIFHDRNREIIFKLGLPKSIKYYQPRETDFEIFTTTVWSVRRRGKWATHKSDYRGNWAPQIARNLILRYSEEGDTALDPMVGGGTTLVECKLTGRDAIGVDINRDAIMLTRDRLDFKVPSMQTDLDSINGSHGSRESRVECRESHSNANENKTDSRLMTHDSEDYNDRKKPSTTTIKTYVGDARNLDNIQKESIDLIATHPPYANIIEYGEKKVEGDLSNVKSIKEFCKEMRVVANECFRVLKPGKFCAILIGDTRRHKHFVPITPRVMDEFLEAGFVLRESIIKRQWNCMTTGFWTNKSIENNFLLIMHEHIYVFRKPEKDEKLSRFKESMF